MEPIIDSTITEDPVVIPDIVVEDPIVEIVVEKVSDTEVIETTTITSVTTEKKTVEDFDSQIKSLQDGIQANQDQITFFENLISEIEARKKEVFGN